MVIRTTTARGEKWELAAQGLMSVEEARRFLGVSRTTLYGLMDTGLVPFVKIGTARRIPRAALVEFIAQNMRVGRSA